MNHVTRPAAAVRENNALYMRRESDRVRTEYPGTERRQGARRDFIELLQQANERLMIATIEAQKLAEQVKIATDQMEHAKIAAEKANLAKSTFLSSMSHELRTPLNAVLGFAQLLEMGPPALTAAQAERLQQISTAGWYLLELVNQILDLAVIESGKLKLEYEPVCLTEMMAECEGMTRLPANKINIHVHSLPVEPGLVIHSDRIRLKQIILNLLSNAIKYNHSGGTVEVKCTSLPEHIRINVKDNGIGLSPEMQAQLFQPFNRLGQELGPRQGTGIGLVVTKQLVALMGGTISVSSEVGVGSDFWIELPREKQAHLATAGGAEETSSREAADENN